MALIGMAIFSTEENGKDEYLEKTLQSLKDTVDFSKHRLQVSINAFTEQTEELIRNKYRDIIDVRHWNKSNIGTAESINKVWRNRSKGENVIKMDDDVIFYQNNWIDLLEEAIGRDPLIGICGCKRKDCIESPYTEGFYKSTLYMLPHEGGERWIIGEEVNHVMGTAQLYSSKLLDKIGYLWQPGLYGFDDSFGAIRSLKAGFKNVFIPSIEIEHIDPGTTPYQAWKEKEANSVWHLYPELVKGFQDGSRNIYYNPFQ